MSQTTSALSTTIDPFDLPCVSLRNKSNLPSKSGLYFVLDVDRVLYIGKTINFKRRWSNHHRYKQVKAIAKNPVIAWLEIKDINLLDAEFELIFRFKPELNGQKVGKPNWIVVEQRPRRYSVDFNGFPIVSPATWQEENANWSANPSLKGWAYVENEELTDELL